jgi:hypothetical protein
MRDGDYAKPPGLLALATRAQTVKAALSVAAVVGTVLNVVNNGPLWWAQSPVSLWRVALNYVVPFLVASYSAARHEQRRLHAPSGDASRSFGDR